MDRGAEACGSTKPDASMESNLGTLGNRRYQGAASRCYGGSADLSSSEALPPSPRAAQQSPASGDAVADSASDLPTTDGHEGCEGRHHCHGRSDLCADICCARVLYLVVLQARDGGGGGRGGRRVGR